MPAKSVKQQQMMGIALHHPKKLYKKNRGVLKMSKKELHDYATTPSKTLPEVKSYQEGGKVEKQTPAVGGMLNDSADWRRFRSATPKLPKSGPVPHQTPQPPAQQKSRLARYPEAFKPIQRAGSAARYITPIAKTAARTVGRTSFMPMTVGADLVFPQSAGLTPKEESAAIRKKGYKGFCKGGLVKR